MSAWIKAARPRTLPLALSSIFMGSSIAAAHDYFHWGIFILNIVTTTFLQILSNFANDYGDAVNGKDTELRQGPARAVMSGAISPAAMRNAMLLFTILSLASGLLLLYTALKDAPLETFWYFLALGIAGIIAAITYTAGKKPYGYIGLGDLSVLIFFGWVGVIGSYYLYSLQWNSLLLLPATSCGLFAVAVLNVNNIRDIESDRLTGKNSIPVRLGRSKAVIYHWILLLTGMACAVVYILIQQEPTWPRFLFLLAFPLFIKNGMAVSSLTDPKKLDPYLKQMALSTLLFVILFGVGQLL
jgi:1,4-dihydroxy-2-naphthoate octaprenyltransferase